MGSGIVPFLPLDFEFLAEVPSPLVDLATRRGRDPCVSEVVEELAEGTLTGHVSLGRFCICAFHQSPLFSAAFIAAAAPTPFDTGNSFCFAKVTGLKEAAFLRAAGCSCPLPSSAALRSALLVSVSDTLMLSARPGPSVPVMSSDLIRKSSAALDRPCGSSVTPGVCNLSEQAREVESVQCLAYLGY